MEIQLTMLNIQVFIFALRVEFCQRADELEETHTQNCVYVCV